MQDICRKAVDIAIKQGASESEAFSVDKEIITVRIAGSQIAEAKGMRERGLAMRIVKNGSIGASSTSLINEQNLIKVAEDTVSSATMMDSKVAWKSLPKPSKVELLDGCYDDRLDKLSMEECVDIALAMLNAALQYKVSSISGSLHVVRENVYMANSNGVNLRDKGTYIVGT